MNTHKTSTATVSKYRQLKELLRSYGVTVNCKFTNKLATCRETGRIRRAIKFVSPRLPLEQEDKMFQEVLNLSKDIHHCKYNDEGDFDGYTFFTYGLPSKIQ